MPVTGPSSYLPTIDAFITHWTNVNAALGLLPLKIGGTYTLANLTSDRAALATQITAVDTARSNNMGASGTRDVARAAMKERLRQFDGIVRGAFHGTNFPRMLPRQPAINAGVAKYLPAMDLTKNCWDQINALTPVTGLIPIQLTGLYTNALFVTDRAALLADFTAVTTANENFQNSVEVRDSAFAVIRTRLVQYRPQVEGSFPAGNALIASIPALTPPRGSTPQAVALTGTWDGGLTSAHLIWTPTTDPHVIGYEARACFNQNYRAQDESVIGSIALGTNTFDTDTGLGASGAFVTYKIYTLTATGNEKGSNSVKVTRP